MACALRTQRRQMHPQPSWPTTPTQRNAPCQSQTHSATRNHECGLGLKHVGAHAASGDAPALQCFIVTAPLTALRHVASEQGPHRSLYFVQMVFQANPNRRFDGMMRVLAAQSQRASERHEDAETAPATEDIHPPQPPLPALQQPQVRIARVFTNRWKASFIRDRVFARMPTVKFTS